jgi:hypothetical protein
MSSGNIADTSGRLYKIYEVSLQVKNNQGDSKSDSHAKDVSYYEEDWATKISTKV